MAKVLYKGFSSFQFEYNKSFRLMNKEIVKRDLLNHIFTRLGERVEMPTFGTRIPDMLMEPMDSTSLDIIESDVENVITYDPRVQLNGQITVIADFDNHSVRISAPIYYVELNLNDLLDINLQFDS
jgi:phage baseplate assembly protein W